MKVTDDQITAGASWLAQNVLKYNWDGLHPGRCAPPFDPWYWGGVTVNARQDDFRDAVRGMLAAMKITE